MTTNSSTRHVIAPKADLDAAAHTAQRSQSHKRQRHDEPLHPPQRATFLRSFVYAWRGIRYTLRTQRNMRIHLGLAVAAIALGVVLRISPVEFALVFIAITGVFVTEMLNTVTEAVVDLVTREYHPLARAAKDVAAGAVLVNAILAVIIALCVYIPHLWLIALRLLHH